MAQEKQTHNGYYYSLTRNILLVMILVALTPMILVSSIILYEFDVSYREKIRAHLEELVLKHKHNIDSFLKEKLGDIRLLAESFSYEELSNEAFLRDRLELLQRGYGPVFADLGVVNSRGLQVAYAGPFKLGQAVYADAEWFRETMKRDYFRSDVFLGLRGLPHFIIAVRENYNGDPWILRATIDFVAFNDLVENIRIGETGFAFILNKKGELQTRPMYDLVPGKVPYGDCFEACEDCKDGVCFTERKDEEGNLVVYGSAMLKHGDWLLVYQQKAADAYSDLRRTLRVTVAIILLAGIAIVITGFVVSRRMVNRVAEADREKEIISEQVVETGKLASVGELAAGIAHEINNPVAIMVEEAGWIEDLLEEEEFKEGKNLGEFHRALGQIRTQGRRCKEITHKLLSFARKTDSRTGNVQVNDLIEELVALSEQRAKYSNVVITKDLQEDLPTIQVSQSELQQVILNLINNALDAMEKEGGSLEITSRLDGDSITVKVADTGPGIPGANLARIFDPFFTTKPVGKGTGLGLSICYGIIKKMGGDIEARSTVGAGAAFLIKIPIKGGQQAATEA
jgi:two-component system, NtrC family, sensor kinase